MSGSAFQLQPNIFFLNVLILISLAQILILIIGNSFLATCALSIFLLLCAFANHYTIQFRGSPISPTDIYSIKTALSVIQNYTLSYNPNTSSSIFLFVFAILLIFPLRKKRPCFLARSFCAVLSLLFIISLNISSVQSRFNFSEDAWNTTELCRREGFYLTFFSRISDSFISKPDGFSNSVLKELENTYGSNPTDDHFIRPNVIVVMNESFSDLEAYDEFSASEPVMPFLYSLKGQPNTHYGFIEVPVFGGNTCVSEFEFLSGTSSLYYSLNMPYDKLSKRTSALPNVMKSLGYTSVALHPYKSTGWARNKGFPKIGFDQSIFADTGMQHRETLRGYISDKSFYDEIIMIDQQTHDPLFLFGITMQNHGGYTNKSFDEPIRIVSPANHYPLATQYINLIRESDRAFEDFIEYYKNQEEPTIVLFFGDHLPSIERDLLDNLHASHLPQAGRDKLALYHTPYYIWANFDLDKSLLPAENYLISISFLKRVFMKAS